MKSSEYIGKGSKFVVDALAECKGTPLSPEFYVAREYLRAELNRELIENQKQYQVDSARQMQKLVYATWALAVATFALFIATLFIAKGSMDINNAPEKEVGKVYES